MRLHPLRSRQDRAHRRALLGARCDSNVSCRISWRTPVRTGGTILVPARVQGLDAEIQLKPKHRQAALYSAIRHGLLLKQASETLSPEWCRVRDTYVAGVQKSLRKVLQHAIRNPVGKHLALDVVVASVVKTLVAAGAFPEPRQR